MPTQPEPLEPAVEVTDIRALRALSHPLRNRLLGHLRLHGPTTASRLARAVGESSGSTSYHLRQLAGYGFVEEVEGQGTGRERWWRARHRMTSWRAADLLAQEGGAEVQEEMTRLQIDQHARVLDAWYEQREQLDPAWTDAASLNDYALRLTPAQARALTAELTATLARWLAAHPASARPVEGAEQVSVLLDVLPLHEWPS
ncbi:winged helix-turn-helix domain-containing protein [Blastococcus sp. VKM Ac-2987]|uniref:winged helix-turn-helix domain-containing protein n=1 Tax=Blastococcus sp. VKM Ac-2987 TaxID=3004141 RepID=UPI0022AB8881|nr:helix-turn-helix domain-containing protein [Blastococcus sp. VKM Ac-2987]MCZ2858388.1 helix-turn-helix domain-containing protein [Blastococcus sp. VKM Ac-2987]